MRWTHSPFLLLPLFFASTLSHAEPFTPLNDEQVLASLPMDSAAPRYQNASQLNQAVAQPIDSNQAALLLEQAYLQGDPRALGQARALLEQSQASGTDQDTQTLMLQARALQSDHQFKDAQELLNLILEQEPKHADALLTLSSLKLVQGEFTQALALCSELTDPSVEVYQLACQAQVDSMTGKLTQAKQTLEPLSQIAPQLDASTALWIYLIQADAALRSSDAKLAAQVFTRMDALTVPALMARADWLLKHGRWQQARALLIDHTDKDALMLKLITAQLQLGDPEAQQNLALMEERIKVWEQLGLATHLREQATFAILSNQIQSALKLARENWEEQKETADLIIYATAAIKSKSDKDLKIIRQFIKQTGFEYPALERDLRLEQVGHCASCQQTTTGGSL